jgi:hypothetical protein
LFAPAGARADWYRNIMANRPIAMETGGTRYENPSFHVFALEENYPIVADYVRRLPAMARLLAYRLGLDVRKPEDERRAHSQRLLMVALALAQPVRPRGWPHPKRKQFRPTRDDVREASSAVCISDGERARCE